MKDRHIKKTFVQIFIKTLQGLKNIYLHLETFLPLSCVQSVFSSISQKFLKNTRETTITYVKNFITYCLLNNLDSTGEKTAHLFSSIFLELTASLFLILEICNQWRFCFLDTKLIGIRKANCRVSFASES